MGVYGRFADLLEYPDATLPQRLDDCVAESTGDGGVRDHLLSFRAETDRLALARLQEVYTSAFDMDADCTLYVGHHLFGATLRRSLFMAHLAGEYRACGFDGTDHELVDHLAVLLRYVDRAIDEDVRNDLIEQMLVPAVRQVTQALARRQHPYAFVLRALLELLQ